MRRGLRPAVRRLEAESHFEPTATAEATCAGLVEDFAAAREGGAAASWRGGKAFGGAAWVVCDKRGLRARQICLGCMAAKPEADKLKQKRRKAARTLLAGSGQSGGSSVSSRPRKHLVDGKLVNKLPFNANGGTETAGLFPNNKYGNPYSATSRQPVVLAETAPAEPTELQEKQTWCEWVFSCSCTRRN